MKRTSCSPTRDATRHLLQPLASKKICCTVEDLAIGCDQSLCGRDLQSNSFSKFDEEEDSGIKSGDIFFNKVDGRPWPDKLQSL